MFAPKKKDGSIVRHNEVARRKVNEQLINVTMGEVR
jgi:hypothetical protein